MAEVQLYALIRQPDGSTERVVSDVAWATNEEGAEVFWGVDTDNVSVIWGR